MENHNTRMSLTEILECTNSAIRHRRLWELVHRKNIGDIPELWSLLDTDKDDDVVLLIAAYLSRMRKGSRDRVAYRRIKEALNRFEQSEAHASVLEDAFLHIFLNMTTVDIVRMKSIERNEALENQRRLGI